MEDIKGGKPWAMDLECKDRFLAAMQRKAFRLAVFAWAEKLPNPDLMYVANEFWMEDLGTVVSVSDIDDEEDFVRERMVGQPYHPEGLARLEAIRQYRAGEVNGEVSVKCIPEGQVL